MYRAIWMREQLADLVLRNELWPGLRPRVSLPPFVSAHSQAALEAKAHALIEQAAAFSPPGIVIHQPRSHAPLLPSAMDVQPF